MNGYFYKRIDSLLLICNTSIETWITLGALKKLCDEFFSQANEWVNECNFVVKRQFNCEKWALHWCFHMPNIANILYSKRIQKQSFRITTTKAEKKHKHSTIKYTQAQIAMKTSTVHFVFISSGKWYLVEQNNFFNSPRKWASWRSNIKTNNNIHSCHTHIESMFINKP